MQKRMEVDQVKAKKDTVLVKSLQNREIPRTELESRMACLRKELRRKSWIYAIVVTFGVIGIFAFIASVTLSNINKYRLIRPVHYENDRPAAF